MKIVIPADEVPTPERRAALQAKIDWLREHASGLEPYDQRFLDNADRWLKAKGWRTRKQRNHLEELRHKHV